MDIIESSRAIITERLDSLNAAKEAAATQDEPATQIQQPSITNESQFFSESYFSDPDKNLNKILNQQAHLKRIIDQDNEIQRIKTRIVQISMEIEGLRRSCTRQNEDALNNRQELAEAQAKELEKYQMNQIKSIADDYNRHLDILEQRKKEVQSLTKEIEREQSERDAYLADVEKKLDKQLQDRQIAIRGGALPFSTSVDNLTGDIDDPNHIELATVDEYAPYGETSSSKSNARARSSGSRGRGGRGRGRRKRG